MTTSTETNPLVLSGQWERVFACELQRHDETTLHERIMSVLPLPSERVLIIFSNGSQTSMKRDTTLLVRARS